MDEPQTSPDHSNAGELTYTPGQAAELLNVSAATLRRMAIDYEAVFDPLPRNDRNDRMWPASALEVVKAARTLKNTGRTGTHVEALKLLASGETDPLEIVEHVHLPEPAELVIQKLQELLEERDEALMERLLERIDERLQKALQTPKPEPELPHAPNRIR
jgi:DNA-binding transcriptional MerR regulator